MATSASAGARGGPEPEAENADNATGNEDTGAPMTLQELEGSNIQWMAKDKFKSRMLQRSLLHGSPEVAELIYKKSQPYFMELVRDQYGNYLSQKILEASSDEQFGELFALLKPHVKELAQDVHGTRAVQKVVEQAITRGKAEELLEALPGHLIEELARSVTGFHVIVKLLDALPAKEAEEILDRLCSTAEKTIALGKDQWGCCVLKKCLDRVEAPAQQRILDAVTDNTLSLVQDPFGNYVVQHLLNPGPSPSVTKIVDAMKGRMFDFALLKFSSNVLEKCLQRSTDKDRNKIINEILNPPSVLPSEAVRMLLFHQYGNYVLQQALEVAKDPQFSLLIEHAKQHVQEAVRTQVQAGESPSATGSLAAEHSRRLALKLLKRYPQFSEGLEPEASPTASSAVDANAWGSGYYDQYAGSYGGYDAYGASWPNPMQMPGSPVYGYFPAWDPSLAGAYQPFVRPAIKGMGKGGRGMNSGGCKGQGRRGGQRQAETKDRTAKGKQAAGGSSAGGAAAGPREAAARSGAAEESGTSSNQTVRVGRIVGFWPNYTVTYDEVPVGAAASEPSAGGRGGGRSARGKAKGKATPKRPSASATAQVDPAAPTEAS